MRTLLICFWIVGCVLCGMGVSYRERVCGEVSSPVDQIVFIATWPKVIGALLDHCGQDWRGACDASLPSRPLVDPKRVDLFIGEPIR